APEAPAFAQEAYEIRAKLAEEMDNQDLKTASKNLFDLIKKTVAKLDPSLDQLAQQANEAMQRDDKPRALELIKQIEQLYREFGDLEGLQVCLNGQLQLLFATGNMEKAFQA